MCKGIKPRAESRARRDLRPTCDLPAAERLLSRITAEKGSSGEVVRQKILEALENIERQFDVRVLLAVESGSRAWGFSSADSDYDVRFIYAHEPAWYLTVFEQRDVIEQMLPHDLDVCGWELRKALRLFARCNLGLNEWLGSPIVYREVDGFNAQMRALMPQFFNAMAARHHYVSMARKSRDALTADGRIKLKKLLYLLRALFACRWIHRTGAQPPTELGALVESVCTDAEKRWVAELLERKVQSTEADSVMVGQPHATGFDRELAYFSEPWRTHPSPPAAPIRSLDSVLARWVTFRSRSELGVA